MDADFLRIDELNLDKECVRQPGLYFEYAQRLANAKNSLVEAENDLEVLVAEIKRDLRKQPKLFPTEGSIKEAVPLEPEYKDSLEVVGEAKHKVDVMQAAVTALEHKKRSLTLMVSLRGQEFFSSPKIDPAGKAAVADDVKRTTRRLGQRRDEGDDS